MNKAESIRESEIDRLFARCPEFGDRERMLITGASLRIVSKLLHSAVVKLRERAGSSQAEADEIAHSSTSCSTYGPRSRRDAPDVNGPPRPTARAAAREKSGSSVQGPATRDY